MITLRCSVCWFPFYRLLFLLPARAALQLEILALRRQIHVLRNVAAWAGSPDVGGPVLLDLACVPLVRLALCPRHRQAEKGDRLAPLGVPAVLDLEESTGWAGKAGSVSRGSSPHLKDELNESALGNTTHPLRTPEAWDSTISSYRCQLHEASPKPTSPTWCTFFDRYLKQVGFDGFLRGADGELSHPLCVCGFGPSSTPRASFQRHRPSHLGRDGPADYRGLPLGFGPTLSAP